LQTFKPSYGSFVEVTMRKTSCLILVAGIALAASAQAQVMQQPAPPGAQAGQTQQQGPPQPPGKISGEVLRASDNRPLNKAAISLAPEGRGQEQQVVRSDGNGRFEFKEVPPGRYTLRAQRNGYVAQTYGQRGAGPGIVVQVEAGQRVENIRFKLERAGVISGTVFEDDGESVEGVTVYAMRLRFFPGGRQRLTSAGSARTDDLGNYRITGLPPGQYLVRAGGREGIGIGGPMANLAYSPVFYPGVASQDDARRMHVQAGSETPRVDFTVKSVPTFSIRGRIIDTVTGTAPRRYNAGFGREGGMVMTSVNAADGTFQLSGLEPGEYTVVGSVFDSETRSERRGYARAQIMDADANVVVMLGNSAELTGRAEFDGSPASTAGLFLTLENEDVASGMFAGGPVEDGKFKILNIPEGRYRFVMGASARNAYLKSIRCGGQDYTLAVLEISAGQKIEDCELKLGTDVARVSGQVARGDGSPEGMVVALIAQSLDDRKFRRRVYVGQADATGAYEIRGVPPGEYFAFAMPPSPAAEYYDLEFPERNRGSGERIEVKPGETQVVNLKVIQPK
jgi:hypothetical protein